VEVERVYTPGVTASPTPKAPSDVTKLLQAWGEGDATARDRLLPFIYQELRSRAAGRLRRERPDHSLKPSDLVHETYLRLRDQNAAWQNREQFFAVASHLMRRILVDHARARATAKRGRGMRVTLVDGLAAQKPFEPDLLDLDEALEELAAIDERQARLVELRFFGGLSLDEAAEVLDTSRATAKRDWAMAKGWLYNRLTRSAK
jgi:RNA polymerase sigma factor (TIGR02999 family)